MSFGSPDLLFVLLLVPAAIGGYALLERRRRSRATAWATPTLLPNMVASPGARRLIPTILFLLAVCLLLVGFARPEARFTNSEPGATIVFAIDVSGSMAASDVKPTRLLAADAVVTRFVETLPPTIRVALLTFAQNYALKVPPTFDHAQLVASLPRRVVFQGSAIGDAVADAVKTAVLSSGPPHQKASGTPASVLVVSDGGQNSGQLSPSQVAALAKKAGVPISALEVGTTGGSVTQQLKINGSNKTSPVTTQVPAQPATLAQLASGSGGSFFTTASATTSLDHVYTDLSDRAIRTHELREITVPVAGAAFALMLIGAVCSGLWFRRLV